MWSHWCHLTPNSFKLTTNNSSAFGKTMPTCLNLTLAKYSKEWIRTFSMCMLRSYGSTFPLTERFFRKRLPFLRQVYDQVCIFIYTIHLPYKRKWQFAFLELHFAKKIWYRIDQDMFFLNVCTLALLSCR